MTKPYCGIKKIPKGRKRGSMKECVANNQVSFWGLNKVDKKIIDAKNNKKNIAETASSVQSQIITFRARLKKLVNVGLAAKKKKDVEKLEEIKEQVLDLDKKLKSLQKKKKRLTSKQSRSSKKRASKKATKKRASKKATKKRA